MNEYTYIVWEAGNPNKRFTTYKRAKKYHDKMISKYDFDIDIKIEKIRTKVLLAEIKKELTKHDNDNDNDDWLTNYNNATEHTIYGVNPLDYEL